MKLKFDPLFTARALVLLEIIALSVSTAATVVVEILFFLTVLGFGPLRQRLFAGLKQPMVAMALVMYAMVGLCMVYSVAPFSEALDMWGSWRKYLMVPFVVALYDDPRWKHRFALVFIGLMTLAGIISLAGYLFDFTIYHKFPPGIVVDNHATQGMFFSAAVFTCMVLLRFPTDIPGPPKWTLWAASLILTISIFFVTSGRSGYLAFMVYAVLLVLWSTQGKKRVVLAAVVPMIILTGLMISPVAKDRIKMGLSEMQTYEQDAQVTSMGVRVIWWKNTVTLLQKMEHPLLGYGTSGFETAYSRQVAGQKGWQGKPTTDPHNQFLKIWVEHGLIGLMIFLLFIGSFFLQKAPKPFYYLGIGTLLAWCTTSMFSGHFTTFQDGRFLLIWTSVMLGAAPPKTRSGW